MNSNTIVLDGQEVTFNKPRQLAQYRTPSFILGRVQFKSSSMRGEWYYNYDSVPLYDNSYVVYSYSTAIAEYHDGVWYVNDTTYSVTTTRHQGYVRRALSHLIHDDNVVHLYHVPRGSSRLHFYMTNGRIRRADRIRKTVNLYSDYA